MCGDELTINYGVCQGTTLGPALFNIYINDLCDMIIRGKIFVFADDTAILCEGDTWADVFRKATIEIARIKEWLNDNLLTLNTDKTKYITFSAQVNGQPSNIYTLKLHDCDNWTDSDCDCPILERVKHTKYLGVIIDNRLRWHEHTDFVVTRLRRLIYVFLKLREFLDKKYIKMVYHSIVESIISYGIIGWGGAADTTVNKIQVIQNTILRIITKQHWSDISTDTLYETFRVLDLKQLYLKVLLMHTYKYKFATLEPVKHKYETRTKDNNNVLVPKVNLTITGTHAFHIMPRMFNKLPNDMRNREFSNTGSIKKRVITWLHLIGREGAAQVLTPQYRV